MSKHIPSAQVARDTLRAWCEYASAVLVADALVDFALRGLGLRGALGTVVNVEYAAAILLGACAIALFSVVAYMLIGASPAESEELVCPWPRGSERRFELPPGYQAWRFKAKKTSSA